MKLDILILAAGLGTRMKSNTPKVMHELLGKPMLEYIVDVSKELSPDRIVLLTGNGSEKVRSFFEKSGIVFALQEHQRGTGDAVKSALPHLDSNSVTIVLSGDVPLITSGTLKHLTEVHVNNKNIITLLSMIPKSPKGYGRIVKENGKFSKIVEEKDADASIKAINEVNAGIYAFDTEFLKNHIEKLECNNSQNEYYLTDMIKIASGLNLRTESILTDDPSEVSGINDREQLCAIEQIMLARKLDSLMKSGVTIKSPQTVFIDYNVIIDRDVIIEPSVVILGNTHIKSGSVIKSFTRISNSVINENSILNPFSEVKG